MNWNWRVPASEQTSRKQPGTFPAFFREEMTRFASSSDEKPKRAPPRHTPIDNPTPQRGNRRHDWQMAWAWTASGYVLQALGQGTSPNQFRVRLGACECFKLFPWNKTNSKHRSLAPTSHRKPKFRGLAQYKATIVIAYLNDFLF